MKKKTKHIIIIASSVIIYLSLFFIPTHGDLLLVSIRFVVQLFLIWFCWYRSSKILEKIHAATKLLELIENSDLTDCSGICSVIFNNFKNQKENLRYVKLLTPTKKQREQFGNQSHINGFWFKTYNWDIRIKYLQSYL
jgi:hypothetical protein